MKTLKKRKNLGTICTIITAGSFILLMLFALSCNQQDVEPVTVDDVMAMDAEQSLELTAKIAHLRQISKDGPIYFSGFQNYYTYAVKSKEVLQDGDVDCIAMLDFLEGQNIQLTLSEWPGTPFERTSTLIGKMTPSGQVKLSFLESGIIDIIEMHSGCDVYGGPGVNQNNLVYQGSFDGDRLLAVAPFYTKCEVFPYPIPTPVEGPVHWKWTIDVTVD